MASKTVTRSTTQTFDCCAKISFLISIVFFFIVLDTWQDKTVMWHSSERVYLCTGEWFADFPLLTKTTKSGYRVFFEISLKTIRPSCILTGHLIYERTPFLNKAAPRNKNFVQKALRGEEGMGWWLGKKGKESFPTLRPPPPPFTPRTCSQAKLLHPYSNNASLIADFSRIFTTFFLCHGYRFWTKHWKRKERHAVMCYSRTRSFKLAPLPLPWNRPLADKSKYFRSTAGLFRVNTVLSWGWENFGPP